MAGGRTARCGAGARTRIRPDCGPWCRRCRGPRPRLLVRLPARPPRLAWRWPWAVPGFPRGVRMGADFVGAWPGAPRGRHGVPGAGQPAALSEALLSCEVWVSCHPAAGRRLRRLEAAGNRGQGAGNGAWGLPVRTRGIAGGCAPGAGKALRKVLTERARVNPLRGRSGMRGIRGAPGGALRPRGETREEGEGLTGRLVPGAR